MKWRVEFILLLAAVLMFCCQCGKADEEEKMGRYVEETVEIPDKGHYVNLVQSEQMFRLIDIYGEDLLSLDGGKTIEKAEVIDAACRDMHSSVIVSVTGAPNGSRILAEYVNGTQIWTLINGEGQEILLDELNREGYPRVYYGEGYFYMCREQEIYQINPDNGDVTFLTECTYYPMYLTATEKQLFIIHQDGVLLYDLEKGAVAEKQDELLSSFFAGRKEYSADGSMSMLLYPYGEALYLVTQNGVYQHNLYEEDIECIIDGSMYGISKVDRSFVNLAVIEEAEEKAFYIYYSDGTLMRYVKDQTLSAEPEISLRVYSLYEDGNIRQTVSAYRQKYPELYIKYEVGVNPDYGTTQEDALRNLSTEIAAGNGPDILVMDDINFKSYAEKGILEDLTAFKDSLSDEAYFMSVINGFKSEEGLYVIPLTFAVPVLAGEEDRIVEAGAVESLQQLADILEESAKEQAGSVIGFRNAEEALRLFAQSSMGTWIMEDGSLNRTALEEFLTQVKRIYDVQMKDMPPDAGNGMIGGLEWGSGENSLARRMESYGLTENLGISLSYFPNQPFYAGFLVSTPDVFPLALTKLDYVRGDYILMPGQSYGTCLPATLLAMNSTSKNKEECKRYLEYIFSENFQSNVSLNGIPVNKEAYQSGKINPRGHGVDTYGAFGFSTPDGNRVILEILWPSEEDYEQLDSLINNISGVSYCDSRVYAAVIELGQAALTGESEVKEVLDAIEEELELYLAE